MVKFKCCRQTFHCKVLLAEHTATHKGGKIPEKSMPFKKRTIWKETASPPETPNLCPTPPPILSPQQPQFPPTPPATPQSLSSPPNSPSLPSRFPAQSTVEILKHPNTDIVKRKRARKIKRAKLPIEPIENKFGADPELEKFKRWDATLGTLLGERDRLSISEADKVYWNLAVDTLIALRNSSRRCGQHDEGELECIIPQKMTIVPAEEHNLTLERLAYVTTERDLLRAKYEESETNRMVLEQVESQYKLMLSVRTEEIRKIKTMTFDTSTKNSFSYELPPVPQANLLSSCFTS